ncbi:MAG: N-acetyltransferase [Salaquimonas sp.]
MTNTSKLRDIIIRLEKFGDGEAITKLGFDTFGPGQYSRSAFRLREGVVADPKLCFVAECDNEIAGSVRQTPILIGGKSALVLGPLMISPSYKNLGIGRELMNRTQWVAGEQGHELIVLVGDYAYYKAFNFDRVPIGQITFPGPADPNRILACELKKDALKDYHGETKRDFGV